MASKISDEVTFTLLATVSPHMVTPSMKKFVCLDPTHY